jgi:hypothetical protein
LPAAVAATTPFVKVEKSTFATHAKVEGWRDVGDAEADSIALAHCRIQVAQC